MMNRRKRNGLIILVIVLVLGITVGWSALTSALSINGTTTVRANTWDVEWDESTLATTNDSVIKGSQITSGGAVVTTTDKSKSTLTYNVSLDKPKDVYEFTIEAKNKGTINAVLGGNPVFNVTVKEKNGDTYTTDVPKATWSKYLSASVLAWNGTSYVDITTGSVDAMTFTKLAASTGSLRFKVRVEYLDTDNDSMPTKDVQATLEYSLSYVQE